eukprot:TRINITY_DN5084_c0_g5_i1.p1 TRINITY_DN5084_c0_g5~~TRINITY_DN5084_c0_g5_i1.p1  ORF type:complete len:231 (-),score=83.94 TRINITY_DN5084_c0_g5_i1:143-835(-)
MFILATLTDVIKMEPKNFGKDLKAIEDHLEKKYKDKVIPNVGLYIKFFDFVELGDPIIFAGYNGSYHSKIQFRGIVFRPFVGEILVGQILKCNEAGIQISLNFFEDIYVPHYLLPNPSVFDSKEQLFYWNWQSHKLFLEKRETVVFRVEQIHFNEKIKTNVKPKPAPPPPKLSTTNATVAEKKKEKEREKEREKEEKERKLAEEEILAPMVIVGKMNESGLGMKSWWAPQ